MNKDKPIEERLNFLLCRLDTVEADILSLRNEVHTLKKRLEKYETPKNSKNSSKPPSSDFPKILKTQSLRKKTSKKVGGQPGHEGKTLQIHPTPSKIENHKSNYCSCCGIDISFMTGELIGRRQIIDIPLIQPVITEHRIYQTKCSCGKVNTDSYPQGVDSPVSYGSEVQSLIAYMNARQYMPYKRLQEFLKTTFNVTIQYKALRCKN